VVRRWVSTVGLLRRGGRSSSGSGSGGGKGLDRRLELRKGGGMKGVADVRSTDRTEFPVVLNGPASGLDSAPSLLRSSPIELGRRARTGASSVTSLPRAGSARASRGKSGPPTPRSARIHMCAVRFDWLQLETAREGPLLDISASSGLGSSGSFPTPPPIYVFGTTPAAHPRFFT
jgi:hypothetical protein